MIFQTFTLPAFERHTDLDGVTRERLTGTRGNVAVDPTGIWTIEPSSLGTRITWHTGKTIVVCGGWPETVAAIERATRTKI